MNIGLGARRRTVLLVGSDPHARAVLRTALEAAGFSVGEAADAAEAQRTAVRIRPDAILADLMMETVDAGGTIAARLEQAGQRTPVYIVSTAAEVLVGSVSLNDLGISGVFLKPVDPAIVIQTLKVRLGRD